MRVTFDKYDKLASLKELKPSKHQRNKHPVEQIERLAKIMREHGVRHPIHVSKLSGNICFGHGRLEAAKLNKFKEFPIVYQDFKDDKEEYACVQSDNAIASWAELDLSGINADIVDLGPDFDIDLLGIKDFTLDPSEKFQPQCDEDEIPEKVDPNAKLGDIYQLGNHRLMCGDSTSIDAVRLLMNGEISDIGFTSPPYNANKNSGGLIKKKYERQEDALEDGDYLSFLSMFTQLSIEFSRYSFINIQMLSHNRKPLFDWQNAFKDKIKDILIWVKNISPPQINKGTFNCKWEYVFCFSNDSKSRAFPCDWHGKFYNVIESSNASQNEYAKIHRATFPVAFPQWVIEKMDFSKSVLDLFGGSGSTLIACEKTNRKCFMMEIDPHYVDVIIARWEKYTGKKAELLNGQTKEADKRRTSKKPGGDKLLIRRNGSGAAMR